MGTSQISQSATQQTSSSWCQGVIRAASQSSQPCTLPSSTTARSLSCGSAIDAGPQLAHEGRGLFGPASVEQPANEGGPHHDTVRLGADFTGLLRVGHTDADEDGLVR